MRASCQRLACGLEAAAGEAGQKGRVSPRPTERKALREGAFWDRKLKPPPAHPPRGTHGTARHSLSSGRPSLAPCHGPSRETASVSNPGTVAFRFPYQAPGPAVHLALTRTRTLPPSPSTPLRPFSGRQDRGPESPGPVPALGPEPVTV